MTDSNMPLPSPLQLAWQEMELGMFIHFNMFTYYREDWTVRHDMPAAAFNPTRLDTDQWLQAAAAFGARYAILTAQHGEGFCLWPTDAFEYSVRQSPWQGGKGDVVERFVASCHKYGVRPGLYLNFAHNGWCNSKYHDWRDGKGGFKPGRGTFNSPHYTAICERMLTEICTRYGPLVELWFDGSAYPAKLGGPDVAAITQKHQPHAIIYGGTSDHPAGNCIRWVGHEEGHVPSDCWSTMPLWDTGFSSDRRLLASGDPDGPLYLPAEADVTIRNQARWVWRPNQEQHVFTVEHMLDLYSRSVGRNANLLINANPDCFGLVPEPDFTVYHELGRELRRRFGRALATARGQGESLMLELPRPLAVDHVIVMEDIAHGQRVRQFTVEAQTPAGWRTVAQGQSIGHKRIASFEPLTTPRLRLTCPKSVGEPIIRDFSAYACTGGAAEKLCIDLGKILGDTAACCNQLEYLSAGIVTPIEAIAKLANLRDQALPRAAKAVQDARAAEGASTIAWQIRHTTAQIERRLGSIDQAAQRLAQQERQLRVQHCVPTPLTAFEASSLLAPPADFAAVAPPGDSVAFSPVTTVTEEQFADLRAFHGGRDGLLYVRATYVAPHAAAGRLTFGADGPVKAWLNGEELACEPAAANPARKDGFYRLAAWRPGRNEILLALATRSGQAWGIFAGVL